MIMDGRVHVGAAQIVAKLNAFEDDPVCNLFNRAGLPASPFRTNHWTIEVKQ
jgi:hypothetical protein